MSCVYRIRCVGPPCQVGSSWPQIIRTPRGAPPLEISIALGGPAHPTIEHKVAKRRAKWATKMARGLLSVVVLLLLTTVDAMLAHATHHRRVSTLTKNSQLIARHAEPRMEDLLETLAPLIALPPMFIAIQKLAEVGGEKLPGDDLAPTTADVAKEPPKPLWTFMPEFKASEAPGLPQWVRSELRGAQRTGGLAPDFFAEGDADRRRRADKGPCG